MVSRQLFFVLSLVWFSSARTFRHRNPVIYSNALPLFKRSPIRHLQRDPLISFYLGELENNLQSIHELEDKMEKLDHLQKRVYSDIFLYRKKRHQSFEQDLAGLDEDPIVEFYLDSFADGL